MVLRGDDQVGDVAGGGGRPHRGLLARIDGAPFVGDARCFHARMKGGLHGACILLEGLLLRDDEFGAHRNRGIGIDDHRGKDMHADESRPMRLGKRKGGVEQALAEARSRQMHCDCLDPASAHPPPDGFAAECAAACASRSYLRAMANPRGARCGLSEPRQSWAVRRALVRRSF